MLSLRDDLVLCIGKAELGSQVGVFDVLSSSDE